MMYSEGEVGDDVGDSDWPPLAAEDKSPGRKSSGSFKCSGAEAEIKESLL